MPALSPDEPLGISTLLSGVFAHVETPVSKGARDGNMCWLLGASNYVCTRACEKDVDKLHWLRISILSYGTLSTDRRRLRKEMGAYLCGLARIRLITVARRCFRLGV